MRRLLLVVALLVATAVVVASKCDPGNKHGTKIFLANWCENPFHPNGGAKLDIGGSREILTLEHGSTADISIQRNGVTVKSLVDKGSNADYEAAIRLEEPSTGQFKATSDAEDIVTATLRY